MLDEDDISMIDRFKEFKTFFPNLFDWKLINFPLVSEYSEFIKVDNDSFHRGASICVVFKSNGVCFNHNIRKLISKWKVPINYTHHKKKKR